jgi:methionyl-tRNA formyltransferase
MKISILCTDPGHPVVSRLRNWIELVSTNKHSISLIFDKSELLHGDILFLVSCSQIISADERKLFKKAFVLHASDLPRGRGWSPWVWAVLSGEHEITVSLLDAKDQPDTGPVWLKTKFSLEGHELFDEINSKLFDAEMHLMSQVVEKFDLIESKIQDDSPVEYLRKRSPSDSRIDPYKTIAEQFNLLRVCDPNRYPAFFEICGNTYLIKLEKLKIKNE